MCRCGWPPGPSPEGPRFGAVPPRRACDPRCRGRFHTSGYLAQLVTHRHAAYQVPAIRAVGHAPADFALKRLAACKTCTPFALDQLDFVWMVELLPVIALQVRGGETGDRKRPLVDIQVVAVDPERRNLHRDVVDQLLQFALGRDRLFPGSLAVKLALHGPIPVTRPSLGCAGSAPGSMTLWCRSAWSVRGATGALPA